MRDCSSTGAWPASLRPLLVAGLAAAYDGPVEKKTSRCRRTRRSAARRSKGVKVGYETYGKLNAAGDNAIFVPHFFSGTSHAAGKYAPGDAAPGYWDPIIGAGRPIDTDKYFVISADTLDQPQHQGPERRRRRGPRASTPTPASPTR